MNRVLGQPQGLPVQNFILLIMVHDKWIPAFAGMTIHHPKFNIHNHINRSRRLCLNSLCHMRGQVRFL